MSNQDHLMLDLETLGQRPGSVILSIGAVFFNESGIKGRFYRAIILESSLKAGLTIDAPTLEWWTTKHPQALKELMNTPTKVPLRHALDDLDSFVRLRAGVWDKILVWGNGAAFDLALLNAAYAACGLNAPWRHWNERCFRTLLALANNGAKPNLGNSHHALADAVNQAEITMRLLATLPHRTEQ
jgi:exodeoxyribonuclease VIII